MQKLGFKANVRGEVGLRIIVWRPYLHSSEEEAAKPCS